MKKKQYSAWYHAKLHAPCTAHGSHSILMASQDGEVWTVASAVAKSLSLTGTKAWSVCHWTSQSPNLLDGEPSGHDTMTLDDLPW